MSSKVPVLHLPTFSECAENCPDMITLDGWDHCIVGVLESCGAPTVVCYDAGKIVEGLVKTGMSGDEAQEFFDFNIAGGVLRHHNS